MVNNLLTTMYMLCLTAIVIVINTILGVVIANKYSEFSWKKLLTGTGKAIIILLCVLLFCVSLELVPIVLHRIKIEVPGDLITVIEIVITTLTAYKKYANDCFKKFKIILDIESNK